MGKKKDVSPNCPVRENQRGGVEGGGRGKGPNAAKSETGRWEKLRPSGLGNLGESRLPPQGGGVGRGGKKTKKGF